MENVMEDTAVMQKTLELCQTILDDPSFRSMRDSIDAFMDDEKARSQYEDLVSKGQAVKTASDVSLLVLRNNDGGQLHTDVL